MAQPITCDWHDQAHLADVMLTRFEDGQVQAFCAQGFAEFAYQLVESAVEAEATETAQVAQDRLEGVTAPPDGPGPEQPSDAATAPEPEPGGDGDVPEQLGALERPLGPDPGPDDPTDEPTDEPAQAEPVTA